MRNLSKVSSAREEKKDEEVEPIEIKDEVQQRRKRIVMRRMRSQTATPRMMDMASLARVECTSGCVSGRRRISNLSEASHAVSASSCGRDG